MRPNQRMHRTFASGLRPPATAGDARRLGVMMAALTLEESGESHGRCECCGNASRTVWGYVHDSERAIAASFVQWTVGSRDHFPNFDLLIGTWGQNEVKDRVLSSWMFNPDVGSFMIIDAATRHAAASPLCGHALTREETLAAPGVKATAARCLDAVWLGDHRINDIRGLANDA